MPPKPKLNPHNHLSRQGAPPVDSWLCRYCGDKGTYEELLKRACGHVYPPCDSCGQAPECARDCSGVLAALKPNPSQTN